MSPASVLGVWTRGTCFVTMPKLQNSSGLPSYDGARASQQRAARVCLIAMHSSYLTGFFLAGTVGSISKML